MLERCPYAQRSFCEDVDSCFAFSTVDDFKNVKQLFRFITKLGNTCGEDCGMLSFCSSSIGNWMSGTAKCTLEYRIYPNVTMRFKNITEGTDYSDK